MNDELKKYKERSYNLASEVNSLAQEVERLTTQREEVIFESKKI